MRVPLGPRHGVCCCSCSAGLPTLLHTHRCFLPPQTTSCRREAERQERLARAAAYEEAAWVRGDAEGSESESDEVRRPALALVLVLSPAGCSRLLVPKEARHATLAPPTDACSVVPYRRTAAVAAAGPGR